ncbi:MAG: sulfurtransferase [Kineosporiaceae bacterium]|nr:sulfurtransferase [Kineosporiaceae bacterium]
MDVAELADLLTAPDPEHPLVLLDVRWRLGDPDGHRHYLAGHLPGAVFVDLDRELAAPPSAEGGRHPLPEASDLQDAARRWGITRASQIVIYDDASSMAAARAWWLLRWAGLYRVSILDGGLAGWLASGGALESGEVAPVPGDIVLHPGQMPVVDADGAARLGADSDAVLLDARAPERFRGETEPIDPVAGHIPGAVNCPTGTSMTADGRFLAPETLRVQFAALGVAPDVEVASYCGSGVTAAHQVAALTIAGFEEVALYPGSWSQWCADPARPVATNEATTGVDLPL